MTTSRLPLVFRETVVTYPSFRTVLASKVCLLPAVVDVPELPFRYVPVLSGARADADELREYDERLSIADE